VFNVTCAEVRQDLLATLAAWVVTIEPETRTSGISGLSRVLLRCLPVIRQRPDAGTLVDEITYASRQGWAAVDRPKMRTRFLVPDYSCPEDECDGELWASIPTDETEPATIACQACEQVWEAQNWLRLGHRLVAA
jgi:hypothetical protein